jgi:hypothetical protein
MIRINVDFNARDRLDRLLISKASIDAISQFKETSLAPGLRILAYEPDDIEVEATLEYDQGWVAVPDWSTIKYLNKNNQ